MTTRQPSIAKIRKKLNDAFDDVDLAALCMDHFPKVYDKFSQGMRRDQKINLLLDHCRRQPNGFETLRDNVREEYKMSNFQRAELKPLIDALEAHIDSSPQIIVENKDEKKSSSPKFVKFLMFFSLCIIIILASSQVIPDPPPTITPKPRSIPPEAPSIPPEPSIPLGSQIDHYIGQWVSGNENVPSIDIEKDSGSNLIIDGNTCIKKGSGSEPIYNLNNIVAPPDKKSCYNRINIENCVYDTYVYTSCAWEIKNEYYRHTLLIKYIDQYNYRYSNYSYKTETEHENYFHISNNTEREGLFMKTTLIKDSSYTFVKTE